MGLGHSPLIMHCMLPSDAFLGSVVDFVIMFYQMGITQVGVRTKILDAIRDVHKKEWDVTSLQPVEKHTLRYCWRLSYPTLMERFIVMLNYIVSS